jgi:glycosyltransferase involved in cell wall biosynthesis
MKKILLIVNEFPPTAESGVQRPLKFAKYLDRLGYKVFVITPKKPVKDILDYELLNDIPESVKVLKTFSFGIQGKSLGNIRNIRYNLTSKKTSFKKFVWNIIKIINDIIFPIDKQIGWIPFAFLSASKLIKKEKIQNIYITGYPFSAFLIGVFLKQIYKNSIFWIADYRDAWQFEPCIDTSVYKIRENIIKIVEKTVLKSADYFVFATDYILTKYKSEFPFIQKKCISITNGYDEDDFKQLKQKQLYSLTFLYMGKIYDYKGLPFQLFDSIRIYNDKNSNKIGFLHIGTSSLKLREYVENKGLDFYTFDGYKNHLEALNYGYSSDVLVIIVNNDESSKGVLTGKFFEYLRLEKPILALGPKNSLLEQYIKITNSGVYAFIEDADEIEDAIFELMNNGKKYKPDLTNIREFSRENLTKKLISIYENNN